MATKPNAKRALGLNDYIRKRAKVGPNRYPELDYFLNGNKSDVVFVIDGQRLPAHRLVLEMKSEVFRAMFSGHFKESADKEIPIVDTTVDAFKLMLQFMYTEVLAPNDPKDLELIGDVLAIADKYQLIRLVDACVKHLDTIDISVDNIIFMYGLAKMYGLRQLIGKLQTFIWTNISIFIGLSVDQLVELNVATNNCINQARRVLKK